MLFPPKYVMSIILIAIAYKQIHSQNASGYNFQAFTSTYSSLTGTTNVPGHTATADNAISSAVNIGFPFKFAGVNYSQLYVSSNGWISFTASTNSEPNNAWIQMNAQRPTLFPLWDNLQNGNIPRYRIDGSAPNRIFKLEWYQSEWSASSNGDVISFQIWLYESSNIIDFRYLRGGTDISSGSASIGIFDHNGKHLALNNASATPTPQNGPLATNINSKPADNQVYRFTPPAYNVSYSNLNYGNQIWCAGETRNVTIQVTNRGTATLTNSGPTINIAAKWDGDATYTYKVPANNLLPGNTATYTLPITAPINAGVNHLTFDVIIEGSCELASNSGLCKSDNSVFPSNHIIIKEIPQIDAGMNTAICGGSTTLSGSTSGIYEPIVIYSENFESFSNVFLTSSSANWRSQTILSSSSQFQITEDCMPINGTKCLNMNDGLGTNCDYRWGQPGNLIAFKQTPINASGFSNLSLNFKWKGYGESTDYGKVVYSLNGTTWIDLAPTLNFGAEWANYNNLNLPASLNNQIFYLGFRWVSGGGTGAAPGLAIDDILLLGNTGIQQPVTFNWSPTLNLSNPNILNPIANPTNSTTYTLSATSSGCSSSDTVRVRIDVPSEAPSSMSGTGTICRGGSSTLKQQGGTLNGSSVYQWYQTNCASSLIGIGDSIVVTPNTTTQYFVRASANGACPPSACINGTVSLPSMTNQLAIHNDTATCSVNQNGFIHFYHAASGRLLASINSNGQNLGKVKITSFVDAAPLLVPDCYSPNPNFATSTLQRHWLITPQFQPIAPVTVRLPYYNSEYTLLASQANNNANINDDVPIAVGSLFSSKYSGPNNLNGNIFDNCSSMGGNINATTLHSSVNNNNSSIPNFPITVNNAHFSDYSITSFSEFWLHGSQNNSPLPIVLNSFEVECKADKVQINWSTQSESNNSHFILQRSVNNIDWDFVSQIVGSGTSNQLKEYTYTDIITSRNILYYRLSQVDYDGKTEIFTPKSTICKDIEENNLLVYPNPAVDKFTIEFNAIKDYTDAELSIIDMTGRIVYLNQVQLTQGKNHIPYFNLTLSDGAYIVKLISKSELLGTTKVLIHKQ